MEHPFEVGESYRNRKFGRYEVLSIDEPKMLVRLEDGREVKFTIEIQAQIWANIQLDEAEEATKKPARRKSPSSKKIVGETQSAKQKKQEKLVAEILETDEAIFEILTRLTIPPGQINTYRFFLKNRHDYFSQQQIADATRNSDTGSLGGVFMAFGRRIGSSPDPRVSSLYPRNALFFQHKRQGGDTLLRIRYRIVEIFESYPQFYGFLMNDIRPWLPDEFGSEHWTHNPMVHKRQMAFFGLWDRYQAEKG